MTPFDPDWPEMKFDTINLIFMSKIIIPQVFMTQAHMSHRELIFKPKSKIWPQMTPCCQILSKLLLHPSLKLIESIDNKKN